MDRGHTAVRNDASDTHIGDSGTRCSLCGGNAGTLINGSHALCAVRAEHGAPTPSLGTRCERCNGSGTTGRGGVMLSFDLGPAAIERSIKAQFPPCQHCGGKGYTE